MIVSLIGLAAVIGAIAVGRSAFDGTVTDKPFERGLVWDDVQKEKAASGWSVSIQGSSMRVGHNEIIISVTDREKKPLAAAGVSLTLSRPSSAFHDRTYAMPVSDDSGQSRAEVELPLYGYWDAKVLISKEGKNISFDNKIFAAQGK